MKSWIDFSTETAVSLPLGRRALCAVLKQVFGHAPRRSDLDAWSRRGLVCRETGERFYLEVMQAGNQLKTSVEAAYRFLRAINGGAECPFCKTVACMVVERVVDGKKIPVCGGCRKEVLKWTLRENPVYREPHYYAGDDGDA